MKANETGFARLENKLRFVFVLISRSKEGNSAGEGMAGCLVVYPHADELNYSKGYEVKRKNISKGRKRRPNTFIMAGMR